MEKLTAPKNDTSQLLNGDLMPAKYPESVGKTQVLYTYHIPLLSLFFEFMFNAVKHGKTKDKPSLLHSRLIIGHTTMTNWVYLNYSVF